MKEQHQTYAEDARDVAERVSKRRRLLRAEGLRPVQLWLPDTRSEGFAAECRRQSRLVRQAAARGGRARARIELRRGDLVTLDGRAPHKRGIPAARDLALSQALARALARGAARQALVMQAAEFEDCGVVAVLPLTAGALAAPLLRIRVVPEETRVTLACQFAMIERITTVPRQEVRSVFGHASAASLLAVERALAVVLGFARRD